VIALLIFAGVSAFILLCGLLSFSLMFSDVAPSQNEYCWPYLIPAGLIGLAISVVAALVRWLA
jgi:hypothetical protein